MNMIAATLLDVMYRYRDQRRDCQRHLSHRKKVEFRGCTDKEELKSYTPTYHPHQSTHRSNQVRFYVAT